MSRTGAVDPVQARYASWLEWGTRAGFLLLVAGFAAYTTGFVPAHVPVDRLPSLWGLPATEFLAQTGIGIGWGWLGLVRGGDMMNLVGIALLASCSLPCLAAVAPLFHARGDRIHAWICALEIAVILLAASGLLAIGH
ncbi:MAG: hypothetical protein IPJ28_16400 [Betaproteobacteria bacterium]|nr:hypothetical protein [Betaproteobacteria bacterium]